MKEVFCVDVNRKVPEITVLFGEELEFDKKFFNAKDVKSLQKAYGWNTRIFLTDAEAEKFLTSFKSLKLPLLKNAERRPYLLYKRHYLKLAALGIKCATVRDYKRDWKPGTKINLHDQTYCIPATITSIRKVEEGYRYEYTI